MNQLNQKKKYFFLIFYFMYRKIFQKYSYNCKLMFTYYCLVQYSFGELKWLEIEATPVLKKV